jgi:hypothetical protein
VLLRNVSKLLNKQPVAGCAGTNAPVLSESSIHKIFVS